MYYTVFYFVYFSLAIMISFSVGKPSVAAPHDDSKDAILAATWCGGCHQVKPGLGRGSKHLAFSALARRPHMTPQFVTDWVGKDGHPGVPPFRLGNSERDRIANFLISLRPGSEEAATVSAGSPAGKIPAGRGHMAKASSSGFYVAPAGVVVTAAHGVRECRNLGLVKGERLIRATLIDIEAKADVALVRSEPSAHVAVLGDDADIEAGVQVVSFGFPLPSILSSSGVMDFGRISAVSGIGDNARKMQITIPAYAGASGSAVFTEGGKVLGVITSRINRRLVAAGIPEDDIAVGTITFAAKVSAIRALMSRHSIEGANGSTSIASARKAAVRIVCDPTGL